MNQDEQNLLGFNVRNSEKLIYMALEGVCQLLN